MRNNNYHRNNGRNNQGATPEELRAEARNRVTEAHFQDSWIKEGADAQFVTFAEAMGKEMAKNGLTTSQIRNVYGEIKRIQMKGYDEERSSFSLLRPKVAYAVGRNDQNRGLMLFQAVFERASGLVTDKTTYKNFCNLMEAIVAYHKANNGKDY